MCFSGQKCRQVGGKAGHPMFVFENRAESTLEKCDPLLTKSHFFLYSCMMSAFLPSTVLEGVPVGGRCPTCLRVHAKWHAALSAVQRFNFQIVQNWDVLSNTAGRLS